MAQLLIRNVGKNVVEHLKTLAKQHHRSLQDEVKLILEGIVNMPESIKPL